MVEMCPNITGIKNINIDYIYLIKAIDFYIE